MEAIKPIETEYKGYRFRSRLEARWAVIFDALGAKWEYEPEGFDLGDGLYYLPDFLLRNVTIRKREVRDLYVEVKGAQHEGDAEKIERFTGLKHDRYEFAYVDGTPLYVVGSVPSGESVYNLFEDAFRRECQFYADGGTIALFSHYTIDGDRYTALLCADGFGGVRLDTDSTVTYRGDCEERTLAAYAKARQARFEHGENPDNTRRTSRLITLPARVTH